MSLRSLIPLFALAACTAGEPATDETDETDGSADTDDTDAGDDPETDDGSDEESDGSDEPDAGTTWTGTWSYTWVDYIQDLSWSGQGQKWDPRDLSCTGGSVTLSIDEDGAFVLAAPGPCTNGTPQDWTHMSITATVGEDGMSITGDALFGNLGASPGLQIISGIPITGTIGADGDVPMGLLTLTGSRFNNGEQPHYNHQFNATLRPAE